MKFILLKLARKLTMALKVQYGYSSIPYAVSFVNAECLIGQKKANNCTSATSATTSILSKRTFHKTKQNSNPR